MSQPIDAIFENGVLKPLVPLHLPEQSRVKITIEQATTAGAAEQSDAQQSALQNLWQKLDKSPQTDNGDNWSAAKHDDILYNDKLRNDEA